MTPEKKSSIADYRTRLLLKIEMWFDIVLYNIFFVVVLSFFFDAFEDIVALLKHGQYKSYFGLYIMLTGILTGALAKWHSINDSERDAYRYKLSVEAVQIVRKGWHIGYIAAGTIFFLEGTLFLISGLGEMIGLWKSHRIIQSIFSKSIFLILFIIPYLMRCKLRWLIIAWIYGKKY